MQAAGLVLILLLDLSDFLQEKNCIGEKKRKGIRNLLEEKEKKIRSALQYRRFVIFIMQKITYCTMVVREILISLYTLSKSYVFVGNKVILYKSCGEL